MYASNITIVIYTRNSVDICYSKDFMDLNNFSCISLYIQNGGCDRMLLKLHLLITFLILN